MLGQERIIGQKEYESADNIVLILALTSLASILQIGDMYLENVTHVISYFFSTGGNRTQGLAHAKQVLYHLPIFLFLLL
jgi:hypothetical protein